MLFRVVVDGKIVVVIIAIMAETILLETGIILIVIKVVGHILEWDWVLLCLVADMEKQLTLQTVAAFERVYDALMGRTDDDLNALSLHLEELSRKAKEIQDVSACLESGDC